MTSLKTKQTPNFLEPCTLDQNLGKLSFRVGYKFPKNLKCFQGRTPKILPRPTGPGGFPVSGRPLPKRSASSSAGHWHWLKLPGGFQGEIKSSWVVEPQPIWKILLGVPPPPRMQSSPPGWHYIFRFGDSPINLHLVVEPPIWKIWHSLKLTVRPCK